MQEREQALEENQNRSTQATEPASGWSQGPSDASKHRQSQVRAVMNNKVPKDANLPTISISPIKVRNYYNFCDAPVHESLR